MPRDGDVRWECEHYPLNEKNKRICDNDEGLDRLGAEVAHFPNKGLAIAYAKKTCKNDCFGTTMIYRQVYDASYYEPGFGGWDSVGERIEVCNSTTGVDVYEHAAL